MEVIHSQLQFGRRTAPIWQRGSSQFTSDQMDLSNPLGDCEITSFTSRYYSAEDEGAQNMRMSPDARIPTAATVAVAMRDSKHEEPAWSMFQSNSELGCKSSNIDFLTHLTANLMPKGCILPPPAMSSIEKEWHRRITAKERSDILQEFIDALFYPMPSRNGSEEEVAEWTSHASDAELRSFEQAECREEYHYLLSVANFRIRKLISARASSAMRTLESIPTVSPGDITVCSGEHSLLT